MLHVTRLSRIGKKSIPIPSGVNVTVSGSSVLVKGPKGELKRELHPDISAEVSAKGGSALGGKDNQILISVKRENKRTSALWGLMRSLVANMVEGVNSGFEKKLEFEGIGFRVALEGNALVFQLGFSHPIRFEAPSGIKLAVEKNTLTISGIDKELVGETAARLRGLKPPEPYKGKGIKYKGEVIRRKAGKRAVAAGG